MQFTDLLYTASAGRSDQQADILRLAGVRFERRLLIEPDRRPVHVTAVHPDDVDRAEAALDAVDRAEREAFVRGQRLTRVPYASVDMLFSREPNEDGLYVSFPYDGRPFDTARFRLVRGGWDHEHCHLCHAKVLPGDDWWAVVDSDPRGDPLGVCLACYRRVVEGSAVESDGGA